MSSLAASELPRQEPHVDGVYAACTTDGDDVSWGRVRVISVNGKEVGQLGVGQRAGNIETMNNNYIITINKLLVKVTKKLFNI